MNLQPEILQDNMVTLVPLAEADFDGLFAAAADPLIWEQHPTRDRYKREVFKVYFEGAIAGKAVFKIIDNATGAIIGSSRYYDFLPAEKSIAIGYTFLARAFWGGHWNKAAKKLLMDYAFQFVEKIYFHIGASNLRSQQAITKLGVQKSGEVDFDYYGRKLLHYEYRILKNEWAERRSMQP
jgi:RimJ/RimL family protein N-acetyltransferase